ncbi:Short stature homeobox protein 2 [Entomophthora muscae]|uniref:Short stature homeobox protein 2 n=2 Tax=Entomophthora muscae TaxID=34485 RepID=A0ACC2SU20_9FUNG|nr:Short stature homeobox protein 2 [Entomophthora muscae]KAJ9065810.1 Short stature homeobox protein 2 [Entomophthora muscae]
MSKLPSIRELFSESFLRSAGIKLGQPSHSSANTSSPEMKSRINELPPIKHKTCLRQRMTPHQTMLLEYVFRQTHFPASTTRHRLAVQLNLTPRKVQVWFQNKRQKLRYDS